MVITAGFADFVTYFGDSFIPLDSCLLWRFVCWGLFADWDALFVLLFMLMIAIVLCAVCLFDL